MANAERNPINWASADEACQYGVHLQEPGWAEMNYNTGENQDVPVPMSGHDQDMHFYAYGAGGLFEYPYVETSPATQPIADECDDNQPITEERGKLVGTLPNGDFYLMIRGTKVFLAVDIPHGAGFVCHAVELPGVQTKGNLREFCRLAGVNR